LIGEERGATLVEFGIASCVLLAVIFGVMDFARALYAYHFVAYAAQEGARYAMVRGGDWSNACASATAYDCEASSANITTYVKSLAPMGVSSSGMTVTPSWPQTNANGVSTGCNTASTQNNKGCMVKVKVVYAFHFVMPFLPTPAVNMAATSEQVIAY
jgi:Flp pilus assembly protein TadG